MSHDWTFDARLNEVYIYIYVYVNFHVDVNEYVYVCVCVAHRRVDNYHVDWNWNIVEIVTDSLQETMVLQHFLLGFPVITVWQINSGDVGHQLPLVFETDAGQKLPTNNPRSPGLVDVLFLIQFQGCQRHLDMFLAFLTIIVHLLYQMFWNVSRLSTLMILMVRIVYLVPSVGYSFPSESWTFLLGKQEVKRDAPILFQFYPIFSK